MILHPSKDKHLGSAIIEVDQYKHSSSYYLDILRSEKGFGSNVVVTVDDNFERVESMPESVEPCFSTKMIKCREVRARCVDYEDYRESIHIDDALEDANSNDSFNCIKLFNLPYEITKEEVADYLSSLKIKFMRIFLEMKQHTVRQNGIATIELDPESDIPSVLTFVRSKPCKGRDIIATR